MTKAYKVKQIFTPTRPAINTFVERAQTLNNHLVDALDTPGMQIVLYGHSGCGKTTLIVNKLNQVYEKEIITRCVEGMTYESIILDGFDQIGKYYTEENKTVGFKINPAVTISYKEIRATLSVGEYSTQKQISKKSFIPPQLTPRRLGQFFGEANICWVLEDFHKILREDKAKTSQLMKVFMDMSVDYEDLKIVAIGAVGTARQVVEYNHEMNNRVAEIYVPYMTSSEIESIITNGEKLLKLKFANKVKERIVKISCGLPSICHHLCLNICSIKGIRETEEGDYPLFIDNQDLEDAIQKYIAVKSDTLKAEFDKAIKVPNKTKYNLPSEILKAALENGKDEFTFDIIFSRLKHLQSQGLLESIVENMLNELCSSERSEILVYDDNSNKYRFNNLFLKGYAISQFEDNEPEIRRATGKSKKIIDRLIAIIENDISRLDDFEYEEIYED
ncbi:hypothetical protein [Rufibacter tibetensis]|uniref:AAA+ ATPase domain-containing protein n=1 Tax=Rufibacter tibetensis TaxID=512763 RepID=A0A0P0CXN4_9BACT|nr:hypothetical protein [Rufibacter tibetensis]ALJ00167.1 hypothetical protein DC20_15845 [Rufibacter tibetensis]